MLTEIYCEAFGEVKRIPFSSGLNVIQGIRGNSIGKSNALKIIDYAFGGKYYANSNEDIIKHVGPHDICFSHTFGGKTFYFKRDAQNPSKVLCCENSEYIPEKEMSIDEFCKWLLNKYELCHSDLTFRQIVGLYTRIWNKPNKEVNRPLYNHNAQSVSNAIISLVKLFDKYEPIRELEEQSEYLKKRQKILSEAINYHLLQIPSKKEYDAISAELAEISNQIVQLKRNVSAVSVENTTGLNEELASLLEWRTNLLNQQGRVIRDIRRTEKNLQQLYPYEESAFSQLQEFFPEVNMQRIKEVQGFHESLRKILMDELRNDQTALRQRLSEINTAITENEHDIERFTDLPTKASEAIDELSKLVKRQESLQKQLELYNDKVADIAQKKNTKEQLEQMLGDITSEIEEKINQKIESLSDMITSSNSKAPILQLSNNQYFYGVQDNTGTGKAYTDLVLFDLAILALTDLPILIHDSFLFNNIDDATKQNFLRLYTQFPNKQIFISLDQFLGGDSKEIDALLFSTTRLVLSENSTLFGKDWRK